MIALMMLEAFLPLRILGIKMDAAAMAAMIVSLASGYAVLRGGHGLLARSLSGRLGRWAALAPSLIGVAIVAVGGFLHGQPHYAAWAITAMAFVFTISVFYLFGPNRPFHLRLIGWALCLAFYATMLVFVDLNLLSLYPRQGSVLSALLSSTCLFTTFTIVPLPPRPAKPFLVAGCAVAVISLVVAPASTARVAGYLRRQAEFGVLLSPAVWVRAVRPTPYLVWATDPCPTPAPSPLTVEGTPRNYNVLFISIDTLRTDFFLSPGQSLGDVYPNLASLVSEGCSYTNAYSVGASTHLVMPALYNGSFTWRLLPQPALSAIAKKAGLSGSVYGHLLHISAYTGLPAGGGDPRDTVTNRMLLDMAKAAQNRRPWMLIAHYLDLHLPRKTELVAEFRRDVRPFYARKLGVIDAELGRLFRAIKDRGEWDRTMIVITADHGEELNERGYSGHGFHLYDTVLRVPLIARIPGRACVDRNTPVSLLDVVPLVADGMGLQVSSPAIIGRWPPDPKAPHYAYSTTGGPFLSVRENNRKTIVDGRYGDVEVYDLTNDPDEKRDLAIGLTPKVAARLATTPLPWEPLTPLDQRYRRAHGSSFDLCPPASQPKTVTLSP